MLLFNCIAKIYDISDICKYSNIFFRIFFHEHPGCRNTVLHEEYFLYAHSVSGVSK